MYNFQSYLFCLFHLIYLTFMEPLSYSPLPSIDLEYASRWARFANYLIDWIFFGLVLMLGLLTISILLTLVDERLNDSLFQTIDSLPELIQRIITVVLYVLVMALQEILTQGRSMGKWITKTQVVMESGETPDISTFFKRNLCRCVPLETLSIFFENIPWHDKWTDTRVVKKIIR